MALSCSPHLRSLHGLRKEVLSWVLVLAVVAPATCFVTPPPAGGRATRLARAGWLARKTQHPGGGWGVAPGRAPGGARGGLKMVDGSEPTKRDALGLILDLVLQVGVAFAAASLFSAGAAKLAQSKSKGVKSVEEGGVDYDALLKEGKISGGAYDVLRNAGTERPWTSPLNAEERQGVFRCAGCGTGVFDSATKFDSNSGWPSFYDKLPGVELEEDNMVDKTVNMRQEVHCVKCGGHLGHVFPDGVLWRVPTGKRYCINGVALRFEEGKAPAE